MRCSFWITVDDGSAESGHPCNRPAVAVYDRPAWMPGAEKHLPRCRIHDGQRVRERAAVDGWTRVVVEA